MRRRFMNNLSNSFDISNYMTIEALEDNVEIIMPREVEYGIDGKGWKKYKGSITINLGQTASFKYILPPKQRINFGRIVVNGEYKLCGNCLSLIFGDNIQYDLTDYSHCFKELFLNSKGLLNVEPHFLPATTLKDFCYDNMFQGCTSLTTAPELPATSLAMSCYNYMFSYCTNLTTAPELPATTLKYYCYSGMFSQCTSLTTAPELPATTLADYCYCGMFSYCTKLNYIKMLATNISAANCLFNWVNGVASSGTFVKHPNMNSLPTGIDGIPEGWTVVNDGE